MSEASKHDAGKQAAAKHDAGKLWGGRFQGELEPFFANFQQSLPVDICLAFADLETNRAWSTALQQVGVFTAAELQQVHAAIDSLLADWRTRGLPDPSRETAEDVHSLVERELVARCGELGKRIHTGRSRNDQVATDVRLWLRPAIAACIEALRDLADALVGKAEQHADLPMPGYTHLQRAQPITVGHHALAHVEALARDRARFVAAALRMDECPLGSGALAGTALPIDRDALAYALGFAAPTPNSLDATASRDHLCEVVFCCAMTLTHVSRLCEDYVFFASAEARLLRFGDAVSTGSSLMPQKRNPDAMELVRGKAGQVQGCLQALLTTLKGLPMAYNRDLQTDKESLFPALQTTVDCLRVAATAVRAASFDADRCRSAAGTGYQNATDLADLLVAAGVAFRDAHAQVGAAVNRAIELGCELQDLPAAERQRLLPQLRGDLQQLLSTEAVLARRDVVGGTAPRRVRAAAARLRHQLASWQHCTPEAPR